METYYIITIYIFSYSGLVLSLWPLFSYSDFLKGLQTVQTSFSEINMELKQNCA